MKTILDLINDIGELPIELINKKGETFAKDIFDKTELISAYTEKELAKIVNTYRDAEHSLENLNVLRKTHGCSPLDIVFPSVENVFTPNSRYQKPTIMESPTLEKAKPVLTEKQKTWLLRRSAKGRRYYTELPEIPDVWIAVPELSPKIAEAYDPAVITDLYDELVEHTINRTKFRAEKVTLYLDLCTVARRTLLNHRANDIGKPFELGGAALGYDTVIDLRGKLFPTATETDCKLVGVPVDGAESSAVPKPHISIPMAGNNTPLRMERVYRRNILLADLNNKTFPWPKLSVERIMSVVDLILQGQHTQYEIAKELNISRETIRKIQRRYFPDIKSNSRIRLKADVVTNDLFL